MDDEHTEADARQFDPAITRILLAGIDTIHASAEANVSEAVRAKLDEAKAVAQFAAKENAVHCPDWLGAQVHPSGARGGYGHLIETEDFTVKVLGANIPNRPGFYIELRSLFLHTHPDGARGACEEALCWVRDQLLYDQDETTIRRLEYRLRRESATGFRLYREPDAGDDAEAIEAELADEDLPHIGTLPRLFTHMGALWKYLTTYTLRLVEPSDTVNRSRWPVHPTWAQLRDSFAEVADCEPMDEDQRELVRGMRFEGKSRLLRRMLLGVIASLELEDASPTSAALASISKWVDEAARREAERAEARRAHYLARYGHVHAWVERGMGEKEVRVRQVRHRVQMLLGIFSARGVLPLELKPAHSVGDLLVQHLDDLEREAEDKGGLDQVLADHFAKAYKVAAPRNLFSKKQLA